METNKAVAVLSEARVKIAEGQWIRGQLFKRERVNMDAQVLGLGGVEMTRDVECYCAMGAVNAAAQDLKNAARQGEGERAAEQYHLAYFDALKALGAVAAEQSGRIAKIMSSDVRVVEFNDKIIDNKDQALEWFQAAIEHAGRQVAGR